MKQRLSLVICCTLLSLSLGANIWLLRENRQLLSSWQPQVQEEVQVHVTGAVLRPGVYTLSKGARVADAIASAGGASPDANLQNLNLAKPLFDGEQIFVVPASAPAADVGGEVINLNTASAAELETLPGIGPVKAQAIIEYRQQHGAFARIEDLTKVKGIGIKTLEAIKHLIRV